MIQGYLKKLAYSIAVMGTGGAKMKGAGTFASLHALLIFAAVRFVSGASAPHWASFFIFYAIAWWATDVTLKQSNEKDPSWITIDEWLAVMLLCFILRDFHWGMWMVAVAVFRIFDIYKFGLTRLSEKLPGAWGVLVDDVVAAAHVIVLFKIMPIWHFL
ncbi:MAG: phosphatidylglycerophosphatase A [Candidatus Dependentiae bacterium]|jgi:phosphatidylglycerophosphatase A